MQPLLNPVPNALPPNEAEALATRLNADEDDAWTYSVQHDPKGTGGSLIVIHDEEDEHVGHL